MFISMPKEFLVPVVFSEEFALNEENGILEVDRNLYREKSVSTSENIQYMQTGKSIQEKTDNIQQNKTQVELKSGPEAILIVKEDVIKPEEVKKEVLEDKTSYMYLKKEKEAVEECKSDLFIDLDNEYINSINDKKFFDK